MADWVRIRTEYITTDTSYRKLAAKYGISLSVLGDRASREKWPEQRRQFRAQTSSKAIAKASRKETARKIRILAVADKLLDALDRAIDELDLVVTTHKIKTKSGDTEETVEYKTVTRGGCIDVAGLRMLVAALKDLKIIMGVMSDLDRQEKEARIEALRRKSGADDEDDRDTGVILVAFRKDMPEDAAEKIVV